MKSKVALIKGKNRYSNIKKALKILEPEVKNQLQDKEKILVKPNLVTSNPNRPAAVTDLDALRAVLDFIIPLKNKGAKVIVGEDCATEDTEVAFKNFGYSELENEYNIKLKDLSQDKVVAVKIYSKNLKRNLKQHIFKTFLDSDYIISVSPPKTHDAVIITLSLKNIVVGAIQEKYKTGEKNFHQGPKALNLSLALLAKVIYPHLSVIDGFEAMEGNGPSRGEVVKTNLALASSDFLAADSVMARIMGFDPENIGYLYYCHKKDLGNMDLNKIKIIGNTNIEKNKHHFKPHMTYLLQKRWRIK